MVQNLKRLRTTLERYKVKWLLQWLEYNMHGKWSRELTLQRNLDYVAFQAVKSIGM